MKDLKGSVAVVTGAASGIGKATAEALAREGADLVITDVNEAGLQETGERIRTLGRKVLAERSDVARREEVESLSKRVFEEVGHVDILMNNAGVGLAAEIKDMELSDWEWILGINLWGAIHTLHYFLPHMVDRRSGHIVNVASGAGLVGLPVSGAYSVTKFGLVGLSEVLRTELERFHIGVTAVCPGVVKTNIFNATRTRKFRPEVTQLPDYVGTTPERAAQHIVRAIRKNQAVLVLTPFAKVSYALKRISPALGRQIAKGIHRGFLKHKIE
ncbi:MAG: SDR family NAD(P)-dependent oxidoreductase [bacterium]